MTSADSTDMYLSVSGQEIKVDPDCDIDVVSRSASIDVILNWKMLRVVVAIGGLRESRVNLANPVCCFARMEYNDNIELVSVDYYN